MIGASRIISGNYRGKKLLLPPASVTRPSMDRTKEAVFSAIEAIKSEEGRAWADMTFLDLFAGSGAFGIEALSRNAKYVVLAESHIEAYKIIVKNLESLRDSEQAKYSLYKDVFCLPLCKAPFDVIFLDPPYNQGLTKKALTYIADKGYLSSNSLIVSETERGEELQLPECFSIVKDKYYGRAEVRFIKYMPE